MAGLGEIRENQGQLVFGLDIGTRSIVGTVGYLNGNKFHVLAQRVREHETRAMLDGQIHDINKVGETINAVKRQLEEDLNRSLTEVCIAAAGRVLRTVTITAEQTFESEKEIGDEDIYALSTMGVELAYEEFQKTNDTDMKFYCVGYTPMRYYMNGYQIGNLEGHKAKTIAADLIATFLPDDVVDGLYKAVELAGLHVVNLTLEPIAAIQVAIPEKFRMLNMALVDVGAGTSDISITREGTITAYGMIPVAGDSLTELIVQHCLVDFETAEMIKRRSGEAELIEYQDIMGLSQVIGAKEVAELLKDAVADMTHRVALCIRELNGDKPVSAVFVVGGGGVISGYTEALADDLGIARERVAIRGREVMQNIVFETEDARQDSLMVTPIGICLSFYEQSNNFIFVEFNGDRMKLYDNGHLTVADTAMQAQFTNEDLFPKRGDALTYTVNGKSRMTLGSRGEAAVIKLNGDPADLHTQIHSGDIIGVTASTRGEEGTQELGRLPELAEQLHVYVNGNRMELPKTAEVNGVRENEFYMVREGDSIRVQNYYTVSEVAGFLDVPLGGDIRVNDTPARPDTKVYENFTVSWDMNADPWSYASLPADEEDAAEPETYERAGTDIYEETGADGGESVSGTASANAAVQPAEADSPRGKAVGGREMKVMVNGQLVTLGGKDEYVFVDVFDYIDFDLKDSRGRTIMTRLNGHNADYMEALADGDVIEIYWEESGKRS
ncbi:MAG: rod shape-determining protein [Clostridium sp.]|nr:rod shape-determining protein [Acetatifactor muris]MCM1527727.1 rod shape-determining protein [Bacteroides sp.]MCM1563945.1 rod shape-determining protein [Clostridium sp.]